jgi:ATP-binding cassette subfamily F protein uup
MWYNFSMSSSLIGIHSISKAFATQALFKDISFTISEGDRIGLLGPNGSGKTTLLKILMNLEKPDSGSVSYRQGLRLGYASQSPEFDNDTIENILISSGVGDPHELETRARILLGKAKFQDFSQNAALLSGGWKKRLDVVRALMKEPDLLLLDEPTNHLDLEGILWLESLLGRENVNFIIVSHDRYFLENVTTKIIELNRAYPDGVFVSAGNMSAYMERREEFLLAQKQQEKGLASAARGEIEWLRKSPKARTTKSRSRIQKAYQLIDELSAIKKRNKTTKVTIDFSSSELEARKLLATKNLTKSFGGKTLFRGIDLVLSPGSRLGIVGKNGTGKTTLLKILAGEISQDMGTIKYADGVRLVYFDQHREQIPMNVSLKEALSPTGEMVNWQGQLIHVNGWAKKFLFSPDRLTLPVRLLSGGERARILIAKLMLKPADILFLDEPTNDLDIATLEVIEESLKEFRGACVLISHDRCMMDRVCSQILGLGEGNEDQLFADCAQWEESTQKKSEKKAEPEKQARVSRAAPACAVKLSYKDQKELDGMESAILALEEEIGSLERELHFSHIAHDPAKSLEGYRLLSAAQKKLEAKFARWQELEAMNKQEF